ncbi:hypothetical protein VNO78_01657 [Psophocarpus tetragonolobus]|uniref:Uncharacterized protein n=1 Tax=Psophocarpus tetragonolobus TaxID=3891 RepID=A0AAN9SY46_PSOTE
MEDVPRIRVEHVLVLSMPATLAFDDVYSLLDMVGPGTCIIDGHAASKEMGLTYEAEKVTGMKKKSSGEGDTAHPPMKQHTIT